MIIDPFTPFPRLRVTTPTTWNPSDNPGGNTLSNGNLTALSTAGGFGLLRSIVGVSSGKWYWEITQVAGVAGSLIGIANASETLYPGNTANSRSYYTGTGGKYVSGAETPYGSTVANGDVVSILLDMDAGTLEFWKNGVSQGVAFTGLSGTFYAANGDGSSGATTTVTANFGASPFSYGPVGGYREGLGTL